jgi:hypothetical protein
MAAGPGRDSDHLGPLGQWNRPDLYRFMILFQVEHGSILSLLHDSAARLHCKECCESCARFAHTTYSPLLGF